MDGSWEYHAKWNKSDRKEQKPYDFIHIWDINLKLIDTDNVLWLPEGNVQGVVKHKAGQIYGNGRWFDVRW